MTSTLDLNNIQGDILSGLPKKTQTYVFFQIKDVNLFRRQLALFVPIVKTVAEVLKDRKAIDDNKRKHPGGNPELIPMVGVNIAFSSYGLTLLGLTPADLQDSAFTEGQLKDAQNLGDNGTTTPSGFTPDWEKAFLNPIHGLIFLSGDSHHTINKKLHEVERIFDLGAPHSSILEVRRLRGDVRPGAESGHEHFGFLDGISNPAVKDFDTTPFPGQETVRQGIILLGHDGDSRAALRPAWATDGSFLSFRFLFQEVLEFNDFLAKNPLPGLPKDKGSELLGARLVGRWKSGAPIDITPLADDPALGADSQRNNNFRFQGEVSDQTRCPFAAHIRRVNPRADLEDHGASTENRRIMRRGVQFGPEVTEREIRENKTLFDRGLLFACYSSSITDGFQFLQHSWANNPKFPPFQQTPAIPGIDPIIGQVGGGAVRPLSGTNPNDPVADLSPPQFVNPHGGEYFFSPSISTLKDTLAEGVHVV
jgi:Dyp-type peroxidase family